MLLKLILVVSVLSVGVFSDDSTPSNFTRSRFSPRKRWKTTEAPLIVGNETTTETTTTAEITTTTADPTTTTTIATTTTTTIATTTTVATTTLPATTSTTNDPPTTTTLKTTTRRPRVFLCGVEHANFHPWIAILEHTESEAPTNNEPVKKTLSKGVLIHPEYVLTTVASIHNSHPFWTVTSVRFGDAITQVSDSVTHNRNHTQTIAVGEVFLHKNKDIALIKLAEPVFLNDYVLPVCLAQNDNYNFRELMFHVCKRTTVKGKKMSNVKMVPVSPLSPQDCHIIFTRNKAKFSRSEFCAWDEAGDTCTGDLGGPLIGKLNGVYHLIGLKSYAQSDAPLKNVDLPGVYTRVGVHVNWIKQIIKGDDDEEAKLKQWIRF